MILRAHWGSTCLATFVLAGFVSAARADDVVSAAPDKQAAAAAAKAIEEKPDKPKRFPDFEEVTKDMHASDGLLTVYRFDCKDKTRDPERLLIKIPASLLNEDLLFAISLPRAGSFSGWMWSDYLVRWQVAGGQLKLVTPDTTYIHKDDQPISEAVRRTYNETYLAAVPILSMNGAGDVIIDGGALLKSNIAQIPIAHAQIRPDLSTWSKVKVFPENVLIEANLSVGGGPGAQGGREVGVAYAFQKLPKLGSFKSRVADQRLGYFLTTRVDWAKPNDAREVQERYINRWDLQKRDPGLELSPPVKPITFIIEKTVPVQWRRYVRDGILMWNTAFEKIGYTDAVVCQQQTDDNEYKDYDPEDSRYNFVRWTVTGRALAVGPSRADPRTGQIIDADIVSDDAWVRYFLTNFDTFTTPRGIASLKPEFALFAKKFPQLVPPLLRPDPTDLADFSALSGQSRNPAAPEFDSLESCNQQHCAYAEGMLEQLATTHFAMIATGTGKKLPERVVGEALAEVIAHEVGHTLGLRHNFKGSAWLSLEEIRRRRDATEEPTVASVMDYNPLLLFADDDVEKVRHFITPVLGPYDEWVIEYGYGTPGKEDQGEQGFLARVAKRDTEAGLAYATDEDTLGMFSPDPYSNRYDMGSSPIDWARTRVELVDKLTANIQDWAIREGEPKYFLTQAFNVLIGQKARNFTYVDRLVGGQYFSRSHKGDANGESAFVLVDPQVQRDALKYLRETLFSDQFFKTSPEVLNNLAPSRWFDDFSRFSMRADYPIHDRIAAMQLTSLIDLIAPPTLQRVYDAELKSSDPKKFTAAELITGVRDSVWAQLDAPERAYSDQQPMISSISRNLQKTYVAIMLEIGQMAPGENMSADLNGMVRYAMKELSDKIGASLKKGDGGSKIDFATRAHLTQCKSRIDRALEAQFVAN